MTGSFVVGTLSKRAPALGLGCRSSRPKSVSKFPIWQIALMESFRLRTHAGDTSIHADNGKKALGVLV
jgi:hypothetical protein